MKNLLVGAATAASLLAGTPSGNTGQDTFSSPLVEVLSDSDTSKPESIIINGKHYLNECDYQTQEECGKHVNTINSKKPSVYAYWLVVNDENGTKQVVVDYITPAGLPLKNKKTGEVIPAAGSIAVTDGKTINFSKDWEYAPGEQVNASFTGHSLYWADGVGNVMLSPVYVVSSDSKVPFSLEAAKRWCIVELVMVLEGQTGKKDTLTNANDPSSNYKMVKSNNPSLNGYWDPNAVDSTYYFYDTDTVKTIPDDPNLWNTAKQRYWSSYYDAFGQKGDKNLKVNIKKD